MSFNKSAFDKWDLPGKLAISGHLTAKGYQVTQSGQYDIDFSVSGHGQAFDFDVEVRPLRIWTDAFPFSTVEFPGRKIKHSGEWRWLVVLNPSLNRGVAVRGDVVASCERYQKDCGRGPNEFVLQVPIQSGHQFALRADPQGAPSGHS